MQLKWFVLTWISLISGSTWAQADSVTPRAIVSLGYGFGSPIDQLKNRYGSFGMLHVATIYRSRKWEIGPSINYFFGSTVKEDVLSIYRTKEETIGSDHQLAQVDLRMRGIFMGITLKKLFKINPSNIICLGLQPGWFAHWIRFQDQGILLSLFWGPTGMDMIECQPAWGSLSLWLIDMPAPTDL